MSTPPAIDFKPYTQWMKWESEHHSGESLPADERNQAQELFEKALHVVCESWQRAKAKAFDKTFVSASGAIEGRKAWQNVLNHMEWVEELAEHAKDWGWEGVRAPKLLGLCQSCWISEQEKEDTAVWLRTVEKSTAEPHLGVRMLRQSARSIRPEERVSYQALVLTISEKAGVLLELAAARHWLHPDGSDFQDSQKSNQMQAEAQCSWSSWLTSAPLPESMARLPEAADPRDSQENQEQEIRCALSSWLESPVAGVVSLFGLSSWVEWKRKNAALSEALVLPAALPITVWALARALSGRGEREEMWPSSGLPNVWNSSLQMEWEKCRRAQYAISPNKSSLGLLPQGASAPRREVRPALVREAAQEPDLEVLEARVKQAVEHAWAQRAPEERRVDVSASDFAGVACDDPRVLSGNWGRGLWLRLDVSRLEALSAWREAQALPPLFAQETVLSMRDGWMSWLEALGSWVAQMQHAQPDADAQARRQQLKDFEHRVRQGLEFIQREGADCSFWLSPTEREDAQLLHSSGTQRKVWSQVWEALHAELLRKGATLSGAFTQVLFRELARVGVDAAGITGTLLSLGAVQRCENAKEGLLELGQLLCYGRSARRWGWTQWGVVIENKGLNLSQLRKLGEAGLRIEESIDKSKGLQFKEDKEGPLRWALKKIGSGTADTVKQLLKMGVQAKEKDAKGGGVWHWIGQSGSKETPRVLEELLNLHDAQGLPLLPPIDTPDREGATGFLRAIQWTNHALALRFLELGADVNLKDHTGDDVLVYLGMHMKDTPQAEALLRLAQERGWDVEASAQRTPKAFAVLCKKAPVAWLEHCAAHHPGLFEGPPSKEDFNGADASGKTKEATKKAKGRAKKTLSPLETLRQRSDKALAVVERALLQTSASTRVESSPQERDKSDVAGALPVAEGVSDGPRARKTSRL